MVSEQYKKIQIDQLIIAFNKNISILKNTLITLINNVNRSRLAPSIKTQYINLYVSSYNNSLQALKNAAECGDYTTFNSILKIITKLCKNNNCKTCK